MNVWGRLAAKQTFTTGHRLGLARSFEFCGVLLLNLFV